MIQILSIASTFALLTVMPTWASESLETSTFYDKQRDLYVTAGTALIDGTLAQLGYAAGDYSKYRDWSLAGINGDADNPRRFISLVQDIRYRRGDSKQYFDITYDIDLIWPFGSKGNQLPFEISGEEWDGKELRRMVASLAGDSFFIDRFDLSLELIKVSGSSAVKFVCEMKLAPIIDAFFSLEKYRKNIEWRVLKVIRNLQGYVISQSQGG